jgi:thiamine-phosphate pyrophosphorylase
MDTLLSGFYAVLDRADLGLARTLVDPEGCGARVLQVRIKEMPTRDLLALCREARALTRDAGALLIVNDRIDLAFAAEADGVHLGQDDLPLAAARALVERAGLAGRFLIGISTHDEAQVGAAVDGGASYLGYGPVYATATKANPDPVQGLGALAIAVRRAGAVPVVAIGGVTPARAAEVAAAGAAAACCISGVNGASDVTAAGRAAGAPWRLPPRSR